MQRRVEGALRPTFAAAAVSITICRSHSMLQKEGLCLTLCGRRRLVQQPKVSTASGVLFPKPFLGTLCEDLGGLSYRIRSWF